MEIHEQFVTGSSKFSHSYTFSKEMQRNDVEFLTVFTVISPPEPSTPMATLTHLASSPLSRTAETVAAY